jgi:hypothetical protein
MVQAFTHGPVKLEAKKDGGFELFGGNVCGVFLELVRKWQELYGMRAKYDLLEMGEVYGHLAVKCIAVF